MVDLRLQRLISERERWRAGGRFQGGDSIKGGGDREKAPSTGSFTQFWNNFIIDYGTFCFTRIEKSLEDSFPLEPIGSPRAALEGRGFPPVPCPL